MFYHKLILYFAALWLQNDQTIDAMLGYDIAIAKIPPSLKYEPNESSRPAVWDLDGHDCNKLKEECKDANTWW